MKILTHTPTQLIIQHRPVFGWLIFSVLAISSLTGTIVLPLSSPETGIIASLPGLIGLSLVLIPLSSPKSGIVNYRFDKSSGSLYVQHKGLLFGISKAEYLIDEIHDVKIDTELGNPLFGIKIVLSKGRLLHLCPDYSMSEDTAYGMVNCISNFLSL